MNDDLFGMHAELCKTLADKKRLKILYALGKGEKSVSELAKQTGLSLLQNCFSQDGEGMQPDPRGFA